MTSNSIVQRFGQSALTFALKIPYCVFVESLDYTFRARIMAFCLKIIMIPASIFDLLAGRKGFSA